jgi:hypothetical protein
LIAARRGLSDHLARDVERQVCGIDEPAHKAEIPRQELRLLGNEHALDIELDPPFAVGIEQVERPRAGHEQEAGVFVPAFGAVMDGECGLIEQAGEAAVEICVFGGGDVGLGLGPQCCAVGDLGRFRPRLVDDRDWHRHVA